MRRRPCCGPLRLLISDTASLLPGMCKQSRKQETTYLGICNIQNRVEKGTRCFQGGNLLHLSHTSTASHFAFYYAETTPCAIFLRLVRFLGKSRPRMRRSVGPPRPGTYLHTYVRSEHGLRKRLEKSKRTHVSSWQPGGTLVARAPPRARQSRLPDHLSQCPPRRRLSPTPPPNHGRP